MARLLLAVDFDGTITQRDTLHVIVEAFGTPGVWGALEPGLRAGQLTVEEVMEREFAEVRAEPAQVIDLVLREAPVRPGFAELVAWAHRAGHRVVVLSNGFRCVIDAVLGRADLADLPVVSHDARFSASGTQLLWSERGARCERCGRPCKRRDLRAHARGERVVYMGDGISDRCAAPLADLIFARAGLARDLATQGVPFEHFDDFHTVRARLEGELAGATVAS